MSRSARLALITLVLALGLEAPSLGAPSTTPEPGFTTNNNVFTTVRTADRTYIGGNFDYVGPKTGFNAVLAGTGAVDPVFPEVNGPVRSSTSDGSGGWFIAGEFDKVGGLTRSGLAHILVDGSVDPNWHPQVTFATSGTLKSISRSGTRVYFAGSFTAVDGEARAGAAAVNATTGVLDTGWVPTVNSVRVVLATSGRVYFGGTFNTINSTTRRGLGAVNPTTGALDTGFVADLTDGDSTNAADALVVSGTRLYVSGEFGSVNATARPGIAAVNTTTGALDTTFAAGLTGVFDFQQWTALATNGIKLFAGDLQGRLFSIDLVTGVRDTAFSPVVAGSDSFPTINALSASGSTLLAAGDFTRVNGVTRLRFTSIRTTDGVVTNDRVQTFGDTPLTITPSSTGSRVLVGGEFTSAGGVERRSVAALDAAGDVDPAFATPALGNGFSAEVPTVEALALGDGKLYIGGDVRKVGAVDRTGVVAVDAASGDPVPGFDGGAEFGSINDLLLRNGRLYVAGQFPSISGVERTNLAAVDPATGVPVDGFAPDPDLEVSGLAISGQRLFVSGAFDNIGGLASADLAALDLNTGAVDPAFAVTIETNQFMGIRSLATDGTRVYIGGQFSTVNGFPRSDIAAVSATTGDTVVGFTATASSAVEEIVVAGDRVFLGGFFNQINGVTRRGIAAVSRTTGATDPFDLHLQNGSPASPTGVVQGLDVARGRIDVGGTFDLIDGSPRSGYLSVATPMPINSVAPAISGSGTLTCSPGTWTNNPSFAFEWLRDGVPIAGATASTFTLTAADAGSSIACRVTASNADGAAEQLSSALAIPAPAVPDPPATGAGDPTPTPPNPGGGIQPGGQTPPTGDPGPPRGGSTTTPPAAARIVRTALTLKRGAVTIKLSCPKGGGTCSGTVALTTTDKKKTKLGSARFKIAAGKTVSVKVKVAKRAAKLKKVRVTAGKATATLTLRAKK